MTETLRLCYVEGSWAYFTTQALDKQWGDDWNDAPYEHNAGEPYNDRDTPPKWRIVKVGWDGPFILPSYEHVNSPYSVEAINRGAIPWLRSYDRWTDGPCVRAGASLQEFADTVTSNGGAVYLSPSAREAGCPHAKEKTA